MKTPFVSPIFASNRAGQRGVALIIVLASLVLITVLILSFLASIGTELHSSKVFANGASVKLLAQSAVNMVEAEIRDATTDTSQGNLNWTSQPGMLRTFRDDGSLVKFYKLYSDDNMVGSGVTGANLAVPGAAGGPGTMPWYSQKGVYVDLNEPLNVNGMNQYPILFGDTASASPNVNELQDPYGTAASPNPGIAGFSVTGAPVDSDPTRATSADATPMPVKWLYVLKDGSTLAPNNDPSSTSGITTVTFVGGAPSATNPIVGRMAFWTDDETCKVNINTASEAANPWDLPCVNTYWDRVFMSLNQPVQHEFQRYPGHPATVCLSTVFKGWLPVSANAYSGQLNADTSYTAADYTNLYSPYYSLAPRIVAGIGENVSSGLGFVAAGNGSSAGTVRPSNGNATLLGSAALIPDTDRMYATPDELVFQPALSGGVRTQNTLNAVVGSTVTSQDIMERAKFFLTATSRAPDVNIFNQPRVSMWPVSSHSGARTPDAVYPNATLYRSPVDQLTAFCTTINQHPYYFQRWNPNSMTEDRNITRNQDLMTYLKGLMSRDLPGFGGNLSTKYGNGDTLSKVPSPATELDQILTEIFDYIRSTNVRDLSTNTNFNSNSGLVLPYTSTMTNGNGGVGGEGSGQVIPIVMANQTRGFGRMATIQQASLIFYVSADDGLPSGPRDPNSPFPKTTLPGVTTPGSTPAPDSYNNSWYYSPAQIRCVLVFQMFDPSLTHPSSVPWYEIHVSGLDQFVWPDGSLMFQKFTIDAAHPFPAPTRIRPVPVDLYKLALSGTATNPQIDGSYGNYYSAIREISLGSEANTTYNTQQGQGPMAFEPWNGGTLGWLRLMYYDLFPSLNWASYGSPAVGLGLRTTTPTVDQLDYFRTPFMSVPYPADEHPPAAGVAADPGPPALPAVAASPKQPNTAMYDLTVPIRSLDWGHLPTTRSNPELTFTIITKAPNTSVGGGGSSGSGEVVQTIKMKFPLYTFHNGANVLPLPEVSPPQVRSDGTYAPINNATWSQTSTTTPKLWTGTWTAPFPHRPSGTLDPAYSTTSPVGSQFPYHRGWELWQSRIDSISTPNTTSPSAGFTYNWLSPSYRNPDVPMMSDSAYGANYGRAYLSIIGDNDVVQSVIACGPDTAHPGGDMRLIAARQDVTGGASDALFNPHPMWKKSRMAHNLQSGSGSPDYMGSMVDGGGNYGIGGRLVPVNYCQWFSDPPTLKSGQNWPYYYQTQIAGTTKDEYQDRDWAQPKWSDVAARDGVFINSTVPGDWDNGMGNWKDGPYINKPDEGDYSSVNSNTGNLPYFTQYGGGLTMTQTFFSANRMVPSPGMLGSLPTGVLANQPWRTLLFRHTPNLHPGLGTSAGQPTNTDIGPPYSTPPDSLVMDFFTMPVVEPYAISEPLSTAGRINMNYQIIPFAYIKRTTALQAALKSIQMISIPDSTTSSPVDPSTNPGSLTYKYADFNPYTMSGSTNASPGQPNQTKSYRYPLNISEIIAQFDQRLVANNDVFRAPAEICNIELVPQDGSAQYSTMDAYWRTHKVVGDNLRERPYTNLYPLLTTKSNSYTIHFRVQTLQQVTGTNAAPTIWREGLDVVTGEYRGSQTIERYIDPNDTTIPDYATDVSPAALGTFYKFRVVSVKQFAP